MSRPFCYWEKMSYRNMFLFSEDEVIDFLRDDTLDQEYYHIGKVLKPICGQCEQKEYPLIHRWYDTCWNTKYCTINLPMCPHSEWKPKPCYN